MTLEQCKELHLGATLAQFQNVQPIEITLKISGNTVVIVGLWHQRSIKEHKNPTVLLAFLLLRPYNYGACGNCVMVREPDKNQGGNENNNTVTW